MQALGRVRYPNAVQALLGSVRAITRKAPMRMAALEGLAGIGHPTSVSMFEELLTSSNADMRRLAVEGLARAGNREALTSCSRWDRASDPVAVLLALHYANIKLGAESGNPAADCRLPSRCDVDDRWPFNICSISLPP